MNTNLTTIESQVAAAILERTVSAIDIDGTRYEIAPPTLATLIMVSEIVATFPVVDKDKTEIEKRIYYALHYAREYSRLGELCAVLILGAKNVIETRDDVVETRHLFGLIRRRKKIKQTVNRAVELGDVILKNIRPSLLYDCVIKLLQQNEISTFFAITTSLSVANIIKPTKEVV